MKKFILSSIFGSLLFISCGYVNKQWGEYESNVAEYADSNKFAILKMSVDLPEGEIDAQNIICDSLNRVIKEQLRHFVTENKYSTLEDFKGEEDDVNEFLKFYGQQIFKSLTSQSEAENKERQSYLQSEASTSPEKKKAIKESVLQWTYDMSIKRIEETEKYVVYLSQNYIFLGGAHGMVTGSGPLTFDLKTGKKITNFIDTKKLVNIQPLLREGLKSYFATNDKAITDEELKSRLLINSDTIPLPAYDAYPNEEGLVLTYQQYEIAPYSDGMPTFTISYDKIKPYLTKEAKELLEIK